MTNEEILHNLEENATGVKRAETASGNVERHSLKDQIAAAEYLEKKNAINNAAANKSGRLLWGGLGKIRKLG